jgi:hypothetical protein
MLLLGLGSTPQKCQAEPDRLNERFQLLIVRSLQRA